MNADGALEKIQSRFRFCARSLRPLVLTYSKGFITTSVLKLTLMIVKREENLPE